MLQWRFLFVTNVPQIGTYVPPLLHLCPLLHSKTSYLKHCQHWGLESLKVSDLQAVLVHVSEAATVQVEHPDAAAHCQEVTAAVQSCQVDQD